MTHSNLKVEVQGTPFLLSCAALFDKISETKAPWLATESTGG
jgi:hypothetical protein